MKENIKKLTSKEIGDLVRLLKKVRLPAPYPVFVALCKSVPMVAVNLAVMPDKNHVLLTYRKDEFYDSWHIPGSILRYKETPKDALKRVCRKEISVKIKKLRFVGFFNDYDVRGHELVLLYAARPINKPKDGQYFKLGKFPKKIIKEQRQELKCLKKLNF
ncbi:MAG: NUDIX hydrolase [Patescibacteria group bacterium]